MEEKILQSNQLIDLFCASINNADSLFSVSVDNFSNENTNYISLGLSELALEELGKSYTCLAYYCLADKKDVWKEFWKDWKNHTIKAHRAFFYEFFCLLRIEIEGTKDYIPTLRNYIPEEKEVSFYVDFDYLKQKIITPNKSISFLEIANRVTSVIGPINAAKKVEELIQKNTNTEYRLAISKYALNTITSEMYQQDVENVIKQMKNGNKENDKALEDIWEMFNKKEDD